MVAFSNNIKVDTLIMTILHCMKLIKDVCSGFLYKQFKITTTKQPPYRKLLPHTIMAAPLAQKSLAF
jgi:hypothetical protein